jgi:hypothetical protein
LQWLFGFFPELNINKELFLPENYQSQGDLLTGLHSHADDIPVLFDLGAVFKFITQFLIGVLIAGILLFIFIPLFRSGFFKNLRSKHPLRVLLKNIKAIFRMSIRFIKTFIQSIKAIFSARHEQKDNRTKYHINPLTIPKNQPVSKKKIRQMNRVVKNFITLIKWGEKNNIPFYTSLGPKEYVQRIIIEFPRQRYVLEAYNN